MKWKLAVITNLIVSEDGEVRTACIRTENGITTRSVNHLIPMELEIDDARDAHLAAQQAERAKANEIPLRELRNKMKTAAKAQDLPQKDIEALVDSLEQTEEVPTHVSTRPKRQAAVKAALLRKAMINENIP